MKFLVQYDGKKQGKNQNQRKAQDYGTESLCQSRKKFGVCGKQINIILKTNPLQAYRSPLDRYFRQAVLYRRNKGHQEQENKPDKP